MAAYLDRNQSQCHMPRIDSNAAAVHVQIKSNAASIHVQIESNAASIHAPN